MNRRRFVLGAAALAVVAAGAGAALWRARPGADQVDAASTDIWALAFERLDGGSLSMASWRGQPLLLNFWATWCAPCITEMPLLDRFARERADSGWRVLALAIDQPDPVRRFAAERKLRLPIAFAGASGLELSRSLGNDRGALPFTAVFDSTGSRIGNKLGAVSADLLAGWVTTIR